LKTKRREIEGESEEGEKVIWCEEVWRGIYRWEW